MNDSNEALIKLFDEGGREKAILLALLRLNENVERLYHQNEDKNSKVSKLK